MANFVNSGPHAGPHPSPFMPHPLNSHLLNSFNSRKEYSTNLIYYYFNKSPVGIKAYKDMAAPVVMSIATFRKWNKSAKIHVLDVSEVKHDWGIYPELLNFEVFKTNHLRSIDFNGDFCQWMLSKPSVIYQHVKNNINHHSTVVCCDADIFFLQNPFPLAVDHTRGICCSLENVGYFYFVNNGYDGGMNDVDKIFELWSAFCCASMIDKNLREIIKKKLNFNFIQEEAIFWYIQKISNDLLIKDIPYVENFWFDWPTDAFNINLVKNLHYRVWKKNSIMDRSERGKLCLYIQELRNIINEVLTQDQINQLYDNFDCKPFSIHDTEQIKNFLGPC